MIGSAAVTLLITPGGVKHNLLRDTNFANLAATVSGYRQVPLTAGETYRCKWRIIRAPHILSARDIQ